MLLSRSFNATAQKRFDGRQTFDARPRMYGRFLGDLYAKGLITVGTAKARVVPLEVPKKTVASA